MYRCSSGVVKIWFSEMENDDNEDNPGVSSAPEGGTTTEEKTDETTTEENAARREIISNCGNIDVGLEYNLINKRITVTILECSDLPNQDRGVPPIIQVKLGSFDRGFRQKVPMCKFVSKLFILGSNRNVPVETKIQNKSTTC